MLCVRLCYVQAVCLWEVCGYFWLCSGTQDRDHGMDAISLATWGLETRVPTLLLMTTRAEVIHWQVMCIWGTFPGTPPALLEFLELHLKKNA